MPAGLAEETCLGPYLNPGTLSTCPKIPARSYGTLHGSMAVLYVVGDAIAGIHVRSGYVALCIFEFVFIARDCSFGVMHGVSPKVAR